MTAANRHERLLQDGRNILKLDCGKDYTLPTKHTQTVHVEYENNDIIMNK